MRFQSFFISLEHTPVTLFSREYTRAVLPACESSQKWQPSPERFSTWRKRARNKKIRTTIQRVITRNRLRRTEPLIRSRAYTICAGRPGRKRRSNNTRIIITYDIILWSRHWRRFSPARKEEVKKKKEKKNITFVRYAPFTARREKIRFGQHIRCCNAIPTG